MSKFARISGRSLYCAFSTTAVLFLITSVQVFSQIPANQWVELCSDEVGARRGSAIRFVPESGAFFLWGFMNADPELLQEHPLMEIPEYDMVYYQPGFGRWQSHFPEAWESVWKKELPLAYVPRTYAGITTGSERSVLRGPTEGSGAPRPDLNIVFDQVAYHPPSHSLVYFFGGLTAAYDLQNRRWSDLLPRHSPPPLLGGSLAYDPYNSEILLYGGGHVAEEGPEGSLVGYTGCWAFSFEDFDWRQLNLEQPPPRMNTRMVYDRKSQQMILFGGDAQSHYLADTWLYDVKTRQWRKSSVSVGPEARAGHFTVYDSRTGWVIIGGGYNRKDLTDMWAFDPARELWQRLRGEVPTSFCLTGDIAPERRLILVVTNSKTPGDTTSCNELYPVRKTYGYRIDESSIVADDESLQPQKSVKKRDRLDPPDIPLQELGRRQMAKLKSISSNRWVLMDDSGVVPSRTWGSATFDTDRGLILYWGGGHCGYGGNDVDIYDVAKGIWVNQDPAAEFPERLWNRGNGSRLGGVTFQGRPWVIHGRKIYSYDPISRLMILVRPIRLTTGYDPEMLHSFPDRRIVFQDALVKPPSSYVRYATWGFDPDEASWTLLGSAPVGLDLFVSTPHGVMGIDTNWRTRLNDAGYNRPWNDRVEPQENHVYLLNATARKWARVSQPQPSPQNLYEMTSLVHDSKRDQLILHGAGKRRDEVWTFDLATRRWRQMRPRVESSRDGLPPVCTREAVYLPKDDVVLIYGRTPRDGNDSQIWRYDVADNIWSKVAIPPVEGMSPYGHNRGLLYDPASDLLWLVAGTGGAEGKAYVYAMRYKR